MTPKEYCSQVCGAGCCNVANDAMTRHLAVPCPRLDTETCLCTIYKSRIGFEWEGNTPEGRGRVVCSAGTRRAARSLPPEIRAKCYLLHPEVLEQTPNTNQALK